MTVAGIEGWRPRLGDEGQVPAAFRRIQEEGPMTDLREVHGQRIAMIAWSTKPDGSDDVVVFTGEARWDGEHLTMVRKEGEFQVPDEFLERISPVEESLRSTLLGAVYSFSVTVGSLPDDADVSELRPLGLRWPTSNDEEE